jgi:hypothetical protein
MGVDRTDNPTRKGTGSQEQTVRGLKATLLIVFLLPLHRGA